MSAWTAESLPARTAGITEVSPARAHNPSGTLTVIHTGTPTLMWNGPVSIRGRAHRLPSAVLASARTNAGTPSWARQVAVTCAGAKPMHFSTPIRR